MTRSADDIWSATLASMDALHSGFLPPGGFTDEVAKMPQQVQGLLKIAAIEGYRAGQADTLDDIERAVRDRETAVDGALLKPVSEQGAGTRDQLGRGDELEATIKVRINDDGGSLGPIRDALVRHVFDTYLPCGEDRAVRMLGAYDTEVRRA